MSDDEKFEDAADNSQDESLIADVEARADSIRTMLSQNRTTDAVMEALSDPPYATKNQEIKLKNAEVAYMAVTALKDSEVNKLLDTLDTDQLDTLMKFVYKFMAMSADWDEKDDRFKDSAKLLKMHAKLVDKAGLGCIARVMAERKTV